MALAKCATGIPGLDAATHGGLPRGRPTLVCGGPGCGKSLLALEFVVRGATELGERGVFVSFEESIEELDRNVASLGLDLPALRERGLLAMDHVAVSRSEIERSGEYDLDGLVVRLGHAIDTVGAKRVALDTIETLFTQLDDERLLRGELLRLFRWLKERGVTAVVTAEQGEGTLTRYGLEEYVSDCVLFLDHRVHSHLSTRRLRIVKYRGSAHGTNEYPFSIGATGMEVLPVSSLTLDYEVHEERVSAGVPALDDLLGGGVFRGSTTLLTGTTGTGKTILASRFAEAACERGERALLVSYEESPAQLVRNLATVGVDLAGARETGRLRLAALRPHFLGLEQHLVSLHREVEEHRPSVVVLDPASALLAIGSEVDTHVAMLRLIDGLRSAGVTMLLTVQTRNGSAETGLSISSLVDVWIELRSLERPSGRERCLRVVKSRGTGHSERSHAYGFGAEGIRVGDAVPVSADAGPPAGKHPWEAR